MRFILLLLVLVQSLSGSAIIEFLIRLGGVGADGVGRGIRDAGRPQPDNGDRPVFRRGDPAPRTPKPTPYVPEDKRTFIDEVNQRIGRTLEFFEELAKERATTAPGVGVDALADSFGMQIDAFLSLAERSPNVNNWVVKHYVDKYLRPIDEELRAIKGLQDWPARNKRYKAVLEKFRTKVISKV